MVLTDFCPLSPGKVEKVPVVEDRAICISHPRKPVRKRCGDFAFGCEDRGSSQTSKLARTRLAKRPDHDPSSVVPANRSNNGILLIRSGVECYSVTNIHDFSWLK
jgi:hypothetical protein